MQQELYNHANNVRRDFLSSIGSMKNYEQQNYQPNLYRNAVENLITPDNQKLATLGMYLLHLLTENIIKNSGNVVDATDGRASILDDANAGYFQRLDEEETDSLGNIIKESAANAAAMALLARGLSENEKMILMQCYFFLPNEGPALELSGILKNYGPDAGETNADSNVANEQEIDIQMDQDNAEALAGGVDPNSRGINDRVDENAKKDASHDPILNSFISENLSVDASFEAGLPQRVKNRFLIKEDQTINVKIAFQPDSLSFEAAKKVDFVTRKVAKELIPKTSMYQKCVMILVNADKLTAVTIQVNSYVPEITSSY